MASGGVQNGFPLRRSMAERDETDRPNTGVAGFLARWGSLYNAEVEPCAVLWADTEGTAFLNEAGRAIFGAPTAPRGLLPPGALRAIGEQGLWRGNTTVEGRTLATTALGIVGK